MLGKSYTRAWVATLVLNSATENSKAGCSPIHPSPHVMTRYGRHGLSPLLPKTNLNPFSLLKLITSLMLVHNAGNLNNQSPPLSSLARKCHRSSNGCQIIGSPFRAFVQKETNIIIIIIWVCYQNLTYKYYDISIFLKKVSLKMLTK